LKGKLDGYAMRVPTPNVSVVGLDSVCGQAGVEGIGERGVEGRGEWSAQGNSRLHRGGIGFRDFKGNSNSSIVDSEYTKSGRRQMR